MFRHYIENVAPSSMDVNYSFDNLSYKGFMLFANQFDIFPCIVSLDEI